MTKALSVGRGGLFPGVLGQYGARRGCLVLTHVLSLTIAMLAMATILGSPASAVTADVDPWAAATAANSSPPRPAPTYRDPSGDVLLDQSQLVPPDAYPFAGQEPDTNDALGMSARECNSFALWWLSTHGIDVVPGDPVLWGPRSGASLSGGAGDWDQAAEVAGFQVGTVPVIGSVAQWHPHEVSRLTSFIAGDSGHVAIVTGVNTDGSVRVAEYNGDKPYALSTEDNRYAPRYLYIGVPEPASGLIDYHLPAAPLLTPPSRTVQFTPPTSPAATMSTPPTALTASAPVNVAATPLKLVSTLLQNVSHTAALSRVDSRGRDYWLPRNQHWTPGNRIKVQLIDPRTHRQHPVTGTVNRRGGRYLLRLHAAAPKQKVLLTTHIRRRQL